MNGLLIFFPTCKLVLTLENVNEAAFEDNPFKSKNIVVNSCCKIRS